MKTIETLNGVCLVHTANGGRKRLSESDKREVMHTNWGAPFGLIRELDRLPGQVTESQALFFACGFLHPKSWIRDGFSFEPAWLPSDLESCEIIISSDEVDSTLTVTIIIEDDAWDFVCQCRES